MHLSKMIMMNIVKYNQSYIEKKIEFIICNDLKIERINSESENEKKSKQKQEQICN